MLRRLQFKQGTKSLLEWFASAYCKERNINQQTVADVVQRFLKTFYEWKE
jgi:hypothetical protein